MRILLTNALLVACAFAPAAFGQDAEYLTTDAAREAGLPFSEAVRVGNMLYLSGAVGVVPGSMTLAEGGIQGETRQTMENIRATLERHDSSMDRVVRCLGVSCPPAPLQMERPNRS